MDIKQALSQLDPANDEHWTKDGAPRLDVLGQLTGNEVKRVDVTNAAPDFTREAAKEKSLDDGKQEGRERSQDDGSGSDEPSAPPPVLSEEGEAGDDEQDPAELPEDDFEDFDEDAQPDVNDVDAMVAHRDRLSALTIQAQKRANEARERADELSNKVNHWNRMIERVQKRDPGHGTKAIRSFIEQQNKNRQQRAAARTRFIAETGLGSSDVAELTDPRAPIDRSMNIRKARPGSGRPQYPKS